MKKQSFMCETALRRQGGIFDKEEIEEIGKRIIKKKEGMKKKKRGDKKEVLRNKNQVDLLYSFILLTNKNQENNGWKFGFLNLFFGYFRVMIDWY